MQRCQCGKATSKRPCASPEWQCEQVITHLIYSAKLLIKSVQRNLRTLGLVVFFCLASGFSPLLAQQASDLDLSAM